MDALMDKPDTRQLIPYHPLSFEVFEALNPGEAYRQPSRPRPLYRNFRPAMADRLPGMTSSPQTMAHKDQQGLG